MIDICEEKNFKPQSVKENFNNIKAYSLNYMHNQDISPSFYSLNNSNSSAILEVFDYENEIMFLKMRIKEQALALEELKNLQNSNFSEIDSISSERIQIKSPPIHSTDIIPESINQHVELFGEDYSFGIVSCENKIELNDSMNQIDYSLTNFKSLFITKTQDIKVINIIYYSNIKE